MNDQSNESYTLATLDIESMSQRGLKSKQLFWSTDVIGSLDI